VLKTRLLTAAIALPMVVAAIGFSPPWFFSAFIGVLGAWGLYEVGAMTGVDGVGARAILVLAGGIPLVGLLVTRAGCWPLAVGISVAMAALVAHVARRGPQSGPHGKLLTLLGALYVGILFPYFAMLRNLPGGVGAIVLMLLVVVATDSAAYFVGSGLGRTKLAPRVSPNKTVEGAAGGLAAGVLAGILFRGVLVPRWGLADAAIVSASVSVLAQFGDLAGSALKRASGVKDSGWIFPGHGGLLDRTCSLVFAAVLTYYYIR
jgi:phosphatidate cytidylyltransferase